MPQSLRGRTWPTDKYSFLVIKYPWPDTADDALRALKELSDDKVVKLRDAVAIRKTEKGKIKLHQTKDDSIGKGFVKGGVIGVLFAMLFGPVGWIAMGAAAGGLFAAFDRGIKQKLLKELGENMTASESAVAILVESADWPVAVERMKAHGFQGTLVVSEIVEQDEAEVDKLLADPEKVDDRPRRARDRRGRGGGRVGCRRRARGDRRGRRGSRPRRAATRSRRSRASAPPMPRHSPPPASRRPTTCSPARAARPAARRSPARPGSARTSCSGGSTAPT